MTMPNVLLVEGNDDEHVLYALLTHHSVSENFKVKNKKGIDNILETLDVELDASGLERLGIVVDADVDILSRWQSLRDILSRAGYSSLPAVPDEKGTIINDAGKPTVGVWIMPDNVVPGMMEHFMKFLVPRGDPLWEHVEKSVDGIALDDRRFIPSHLIKAQVHTWLAWQDDPGTPLGLAITKRYFDPDCTQAGRFIAWIRRLFGS